MCFVKAKHREKTSPETSPSFLHYPPLCSWEDLSLWKTSVWWLTHSHWKTGFWLPRLRYFLPRFLLKKWDAQDPLFLHWADQKATGKGVLWEGDQTFVRRTTEQRGVRDPSQTLNRHFVSFLYKSYATVDWLPLTWSFWSLPYKNRKEETTFVRVWAISVHLLSGDDAVITQYSPLSHANRRIFLAFCFI